MLPFTVVVASSTLAMPPPTVAAAAPLGLVVVDRAAADGDHAGVQGAEFGGVVPPRKLKMPPPAPRPAKTAPVPPGRVVVAAAGLIVVQDAVADAGRASSLIRNAAADPGADKARDAGGAAVVVAALGIVLGQRCCC